MYLILSIACGGAVGAICRYMASSAIQSLYSNSYPYGTLFCNVLGSLVLGLLYDTLSKEGLFNENIKVFIQIGILSSFTTFSTFALEAFLLIEKGDYISAISYILISVVLSIGALILGINLIRIIS